MSQEKEGGEIEVSINIMQKGSNLSKVRPNKLYRRTYFLSEDLTSIRWEPSKKRFEESKIFVAEISRVLLVLWLLSSLSFPFVL